MAVFHSLLFNTSFSFKDIARPGFQLHSSGVVEESGCRTVIAPGSAVPAGRWRCWVSPRWPKGPFEGPSPKMLCLLCRELPPKRYLSPLQQCQQGGDWSPARGQSSAGDVGELRGGATGADCTENFSCWHWGRRRDTAAGGGHGPTPHQYPSLEVGTWDTTQMPEFIHANSCIIRSSQKNSPFPRNPRGAEGLKLPMTPIFSTLFGWREPRSPLVQIQLEKK